MGLEDFDKNEMINKVTGVLSGMVALSGVAMVIGGIVVLAVDCTPAPNHPWVLLVWGLVTIMLYGLVVIATHDRWNIAKYQIIIPEYGQDAKLQRKHCSKSVGAGVEAPCLPRWRLGLVVCEGE